MGIKIMVNCGHGKSTDGSWDPGCTYNGYNEAALMLPITKAAVKYLRASGFTVYSDADTNNNKNMIADVNWSNTIKDLQAYVSVHCDWYKAESGVYPLYVSAGGKKLATALNTAIKSGMSMPSRGPGKRTDLWELNGTNAIACILETGSIKADLQKLKKADDYGKCVAKGICNYFGVTFKESAEAPVQTVIVKNVNYTVKTNGTVALYNDYMNTKKGTVNGVYTLVAESSNGYGKLKSGAGWVKLSDAPKYTIAPKVKTKRDIFIDYLEEYGAEIERSFKYSNDNSKTTWAEAKKNHITNCARYVSWALQGVGILPLGKCIYCTTQLKGSGADIIRASEDVIFSKPNKTVVEMAKAGLLEEGDIVMFTSGKHTMVVRSVDKVTGVVRFYSAGSSDVAAKNVRNRRRSEYDTRKASYHIRIK